MAALQEWMGHYFGGTPTPPDLTQRAIRELLTADAPAVRKAAFLTAIRQQGHTASIIAEFASVLLEHSVEAPVSGVLDIVGTGGDGKNTWNISTPSSLLCAAAGIPVAKHGNRSSTSNSGAADVLEQLGCCLQLKAEDVEPLIHSTGFCFLFAQAFHPSLRHVGPVRGQLGFKTVFNLLGPLLNPARPAYSLLGVSDPSLGPIIAEALCGTQPNIRAMVVASADGCDKVSPRVPTHAWLIRDGKVEAKDLNPVDFGLSPMGGEESYMEGGGSAEDNAVALLTLLRGESTRHGLINFILVNAAAAAWLTGKTSTLAEGMTLMRSVLGGGGAGRVLDEFVRASTRVARGRSTDILHRIVRRRKVDVRMRQAKVPEDQLKNLAHWGRKGRNLYDALREVPEGELGVVGEIKRASPSEGDINTTLDVQGVATRYIQGGCVGLSVLTEDVWFKGTLLDLQAARSTIDTADVARRPVLLQKDFVFTKYQVAEAKANGADAILLIVAIRDEMEKVGHPLHTLIAYSRELGMEPLVEVATEEEMDVALQVGAKVIGVNNRDLKTFKMDLTRSEAIRRYGVSKGSSGSDVIVMALSGVNTPQDVRLVRGWRGQLRHFLVGTSLMRSDQPATLLASLRKPIAVPKLLKVCGVKTVEHTKACLTSGVDLIGLMFYAKSSRYLGDMRLASELSNMIRGHTTRRRDVSFSGLPSVVGVFMKASLRDIQHTMEHVQLDAVQLYGYKQDDVDWSAIGVPIIWCISITGQGDLHEALGQVPTGHIAGLCVDCKVGDKMGGTGHSWDWSLLDGIRSAIGPELPLFLAGGINPENAGRAAERPEVTVIDVSSGVETDGVKDVEKIAAVATAVHSVSF